MAKIIKCPSCGASDYEKTDESHYRCNFCESTFVLEEKKRQTDINEFLNQFGGKRKATAHFTPQSAKNLRAVTMGISFFIMILGIGIAVFVNSNVQEAIESAPGKVPEDSYWQSGSTTEFYIFEGSKGPVTWMLINQSSKGLDSAKYTLQIVDTRKGKLKLEKKFVSMTWKESFNFRNYHSGMLSYNDRVYFLSEANGIVVYDLYTGKQLVSNEQFANKFPELKSGIVYAKDKYYKDAIEIMTNDGFKFNYLPKYNLLVSEEEFNNYKKVSGLIGGFVVVGEPRQKLYYVVSKQDTLRNDFSFSDYYLNQYLAKGKSGSKNERAFEVDPEKIFFNVKYLYRNKSQTVFVYTESVDKKSKAFIVSYHINDYSKPIWQKSFSEIKGFENASSEDWYLRTHASKNELAIWYESAQKIGFGISLETGKINWNYRLN